MEQRKLDQSNKRQHGEKEEIGKKKSNLKQDNTNLFKQINNKNVNESSFHFPKMSFDS